MYVQFNTLTMTTKDEKDQQTVDKDFGLPHVEHKSIEAEGGKWRSITFIMIVLVLLVGAGVVYWFFYRVPTHEPIQVVDSAYKQPHDIDGVKEDDHAKYPTTDQDIAATKSLTDVPTVQEQPVPVDNVRVTDTHIAKKGTLTVLKAPQGYYVIVGSFIDKDLAVDYAHQLMQQGTDVLLIIPPQGQYGFRVAVHKATTWRDAQQKVNALQPLYGPTIWIKKF